MGKLFSFFNRREVGGVNTQTAGANTTTNQNASDQNSQNASGSYKEKVIHVGGPDMALTVSAVYRAVELKAKTIAQMQMQYQRKDREGGNFVPSMYGDGRIINYLLQQRANPLMTASELFQQMSIRRELLGNAFVYIERDLTGVPINLWLAECDGYDYINDTYTLTYNTNYGPRFKYEVPADDVIHWKNTYLQSDGYMGIPTHRFAIQTLSLIATQKAQSMETAGKGGRVKLLISEQKPTTTPGTLAFGQFNKKVAQDYAKEINDLIYSQDVVSLRGLEKVQPISMTAQDMQLMETLNMSLDDVARYYATPRPLLMLDTNSHYNDYTNATMEYLQRTIAPLAGELEDLFYSKFLELEDFGLRRFHMCEQPLLRMDLKRQSEIDKMRLETGVMSPNELRAQYDLPAVENGDKRYVSTNLAELGSEKLRAASGSSQAQPAQQDPNK